MFELHFNVLLVLRPLLQTSYKASPATPTWRVNHWIVTTLASAPQKGCARMATAQMEWTVRDVMVCILYARVWCKNKDFLPTMNSAAESVVLIFTLVPTARRRRLLLRRDGGLLDMLSHAMLRPRLRVLPKYGSLLLRKDDARG
jgi:hypothetical protein